MVRIGICKDSRQGKNDGRHSGLRDAPGSWPSRNAQFVCAAAAIFLLVAALYAQVLSKLVFDWWWMPDFSHGFLVPPFAAYLVWEKREKLRQLPYAPAWKGVGVVALGIAILFVGVYGSELFLSRFSLLVILAGLVLSFAGWPLLKELRFALLVLLLAIPLPAILFNQITFPLQILASKLASSLFRSSACRSSARATSFSFP